MSSGTRGIGLESTDQECCPESMEMLELSVSLSIGAALWRVPESALSLPHMSKQMDAWEP